MKYLCLIYEEETKLNVLSKAELDALIEERAAVTEEIRKNGHYLCGEILQPVQTATTLRVRSGRLSATDGPFAETKEQLGGFYLINVGNLDEAIGIAARIPSARTGTIEVRPLMEAMAPAGA